MTRGLAFGWWCVTVSMRVMSAGDGYRYLLASVAAGDGGRDLSTPLTRYYAEVGCPPGFWLGSGLRSLGDGKLQAGDTVSEEQLALLLGSGRDPVTGDSLGHAYPVYRSREDRIAERTAALDPELSVDERANAVAVIEVEEAARPVRRAVAGYDYTFSVPKSVSALWAVADAATQTLITATTRSRPVPRWLTSPPVTPASAPATGKTTGAPRTPASTTPTTDPIRSPTKA